MVDFNVGVVIPAAGSGERFGSNIPKQYYLILGKPLFLYAVEIFAQLPWIKRIALVVDNIEKAIGILQETLRSDEISKIKLVKGESTRHRSIRAGLLELDNYSTADELKVVIIHDGVRPLFPKSLLIELCDAAMNHGAAGATRPLISTVLKESSDQFLENALDRVKHVASETPQAFQLSLLSTAYYKCSEEDLEYGTECLQLVQKYTGVSAKLITGPEDLWKVTLKKDIYSASACIREMNNEVCLISEEETSTVKLVLESLKHIVSRVKLFMNMKNMSSCRDTKEKTFNTVILFHMKEINQNEHLLNFAALLDTEKEGLIIHIIENAKINNMQSMTVYNLHRSSRKMAYNYEKLKKGVVIVHCITMGSEDRQLMNLVSSLVQSDPATFTGQTFFL